MLSIRIVRLNSGRQAIAFTPNFTEGMQPPEEMIIWWDEVDKETILSPAYNRIETVLTTLTFPTNLTNRGIDESID